MNLFSAKRTERNILSASCAVFCISILAVSLVEIRWFYLNGGGCNVNYIGVAHFFAPGRLEYQFELSKVDRSKEITVYKFILPNGLGKTRINHVIHALNSLEGVDHLVPFQRFKSLYLDVIWQF